MEEIQIEITENYTPIEVQINEQTGLRGLSAYEVALANGFVGTQVEWLNSLSVNSSVQVITAGENISSGNVVYTDLGLAYRFDSSNQNLQGRMFGIAKTAATVGTTLEVFITGIATVSGWGLTPNAIYYANSNGAISTTPSGVLSEMVGIAVTSDKLLIKTLSIKTV